MTEIERLNQLAASAKRQGKAIEQIEEAVKLELAKSLASEAVKSALTERILQGVKTAEYGRGVYGLEPPADTGGAMAILPNGLPINLDALNG